MVVARRREGPGETVRAIVQPRLLEKKVRLIDDFPHERVSLRTGAVVFGRAVLNAVRCLGKRGEDL